MRRRYVASGAVERAGQYRRVVPLHREEAGCRIMRDRGRLAPCHYLTSFQLTCKRNEALERLARLVIRSGGA